MSIGPGMLKKFWSIMRRVAADEDMDGVIDRDFCMEIKEDDDGRVYSLNDMPCEEDVKAFVGNISRFFASPPNLL
mgnify:CR=1 FL=1